MTTGIRIGIWVAVTGGCLALGLFVAARDGTRGSERWFAPGAIGREAGDDGPRTTDVADVEGAPSGVGQLPSAVRRPASAPASGLRRPAPGFLTRGMSGVDAEWGARNGITSRLAFSHNLAGVFPPSLYVEHPEFFPLIEGKRLQPPAGSGFWNPDIAREDAALYAAEAARKHFAANPANLSFALGVNDALIWGESPELRALTRAGGGAEERRGGGAGAQTRGGSEDRRFGGSLSDSPTLRLSDPPNWFRERPDYSNLVFTFMNRAAAELAKTHPEKYLGALAYYWAENVPDFPLHPQVIPFLTADRSQGYDAGFKREELELQAGWAAVGPALAAGPVRPGLPIGQGPAASAGPTSSPRRLGMYDYLYGGGFLMPRIHTQLLAENLRHARQVGFTDYYAEVNPNWGLDGPMPWLTAQLLQDPEQPVTALLDEYYARYFREAAVPMRRFFERCEELWMAQPGPPYWLKHFRNQSQEVVFPESAVRELRQLLDRAQRGAWFGRTRARVQQVSAAFGVTERFLGFHDARDRLKRLALGAEPAAASLSEALGVYLDARREFVRYVTELQGVDPLAVRRFGWDDYLKDDPVALALVALRRSGSIAGTPLAGSIVGPPLVGGPKGGSESRSEKGPATSAGPTIMDEPNVAALWEAISLAETVVPRNSGSQLLRNPAMTGPVKPGRTIAGLPYGVALPSEWQSRVEPSQFHRAELVGDDKERAVRISGTKDTTVSQWAPMPAAGSGNREAVQRAAIVVRGRVSPGTAVHLVFSWLDAKERHLGFKMVRLPDGDWPEWVTLQQAGVPPAGATWVGLGLRVQNQVAGDWVEARGWSILDF